MRKLAFIIPPEVELLDLAGPVQVFTEAKFYGLEVEIEFYQYQQKPTSTSGLGLREVEHKVPEYTIEYIASRCGFKSARQLQRILKK